MNNDWPQWISEQNFEWQLDSMDFYPSEETGVQVGWHDYRRVDVIVAVRKNPKNGHEHRGYSAKQTIQRWESVRRGERRYIFPNQENADAIFNSALAYEVSALKSYVEPMLRQVPYGTPEYVEAKRLLAFLEWFLPIDGSLIPDNSILREFLGDSILHSFSLWHNHS